MCKSKWISLLVVLGLALGSGGCGDSSKAPSKAAVVPPSPAPAANSAEATRPAPAETPVRTAVAEEKKSEESVSQGSLQPTGPASQADQPTVPKAVAGNPPKASSRKPAKTEADKKDRPFPEAKLLPDDLVGLIVVHPIQFFESPFGKLMTEMGVENYSMRGVSPFVVQLQKRLRTIERVTVVIDQPFVNEMAGEAGLVVPDELASKTPNADAPAEDPKEAPVLSQAVLMNSLKRIGLAFHLYYDIHNRFPKADGDAEGKNTGLSWRVHLLPYMEQEELYRQFNLTEPWDSENNKQLISKMPEVFQSPGVTDEGKTSIHVFTGEKTPFGAEQGPLIPEFTDGLSNTLLTVIAGADTAEPWTKPGGLEVDLTAPKKSLGEIKGDTFLALFADGHIQNLSKEIDETTLANLIQNADGKLVQLDQPAAEVSTGPLLPTIFTFAEGPDRERLVNDILGTPTPDTHLGQSFSKNAPNAVWFSDGRTVVVGKIDAVKRLIEAKQNPKANSPLVDELQLDAEFTAALDLESEAPLVAQIAQQLPAMGMVNNVATLAVRISASGDEGDSLLEVNVKALDANMAAGLAAIANMGLNQAKMSIAQLPQPANGNDSDKQVRKIISQLAASAKVKIDGERIQFRIPIPEGFDQLPELLKPALMGARVAAANLQRTNNLRMFGLAMHNFLSAYGTFPGAGRMNADSPVGLSWRVHLLPYLDQAPLYSQFKLDEPWDSEHNKTLIEKMPEIFKVEGVEDATKTSLHVFIGPKAPFADDHTPGLAQFTDGTSNTILIVEAGPDTAEIWTKPGGLDFDPDDPLKALGKLGETFRAVFADGTVRAISKDIDGSLLRKLIQYNDGEAIP